MEEEVYMSISFPRIGKEKAMHIRNLIMRLCETESASVYFDDPASGDED